MEQAAEGDLPQVEPTYRWAGVQGFACELVAVNWKCFSPIEKVVHGEGGRFREVLEDLCHSHTTKALNMSIPAPTPKWRPASLRWEYMGSPLACKGCMLLVGAAHLEAALWAAGPVNGERDPSETM